MTLYKHRSILQLEPVVICSRIQLGDTSVTMKGTTSMTILDDIIKFLWHGDDTQAPLDAPAAQSSNAQREPPQTLHDAIDELIIAATEERANLPPKTRSAIDQFVNIQALRANTTAPIDDTEP